MVSPATIRKRIQYGWDREIAKQLPLQIRRLNRNLMDRSLTKANVHRRLHNGREEQRALTEPKNTRGGARR